MTIEKLPKNIREKVIALMDDKEFEKIYQNDKELDELNEQLVVARQAYVELWEKADQRLCQLIADYLIDTKRMKSLSFFFPKMKDVIRNAIVKLMRRTGEDIDDKDGII